MNGADALIETLIDNDVTACFANPGTSEMQFVSALDRQPRMATWFCRPALRMACSSGWRSGPSPMSEIFAVGTDAISCFAASIRRRCWRPRSTACR